MPRGVLMVVMDARLCVRPDQSVIVVRPATLTDAPVKLDLLVVAAVIATKIWRLGA